MPETKRLLLNGKVYDCEPGETVLEALLRQKVEAPYSCRQQTCMSCMMRSLNGVPPARSQINLKETLKLQNNFLACGCYPLEDMEIALPQAAITMQVTAEVVELNPLNAAVVELVLQCETPIDYRGGQSVLVLNHEQIGKSLSVASPTSLKTTGRIEIHVEHIEGGAFSEWLHRDLRVGDTMTVCNPVGELFYVVGKPQQPLLMATWGGALGALIGIMQDAFENDHTGPVYLFHGVADRERLYYTEELREVAEYYPNFQYVPCVERGPASDDYRSGTVCSIIETNLPDLSGWKVFLCGRQTQIHKIQRLAYLSGAGMKDILTEVTEI